VAAAPVAEAASVASPEAVATRFYAAFTTGDLDTMSALYAPGVHFRDAIFEYADRAGTMHMWTTLLGAKPAISYQLDRVEGEVAHGRWVADYTLFGRPVHNEVKSELTVRAGKIVEHRDGFDWSTWAKQALPLGSLATRGPGKLLARMALRAAIRWS
jgi:ketosteroid isomerase-like protein